jgi:3-isopropylmalate dehydrogenase
LTEAKPFDTYTRAEVQRLAKGFELAMTRTKNYVALTKQMYWKPPFRKSTKSHGKDYPEVTVSYEFVDAVAMRLVQWPNSYDVLQKIWRYFNR